MRVQTENRRSGAHTRTRLKLRAREHARKPGAAGSVRSTKDRDVLALEVRAGRAAVGGTNWDAAGFLAAPIETELKWQRKLSEEQTVTSLF